MEVTKNIMDELLDQLNTLIAQRDFEAGYKLSDYILTHYRDFLTKEQFEDIQNVSHTYKARTVFTSRDYEYWLKSLHDLLNPQLYLEIGVETGRSLAWAKHYAIGVDPALHIQHSLPGWSKVYSLESDAFFAQENLLQIFDGKVLDLAFIDGLHTFDQALRDFVNVEKLSNPKTVAVFHDIYPTSKETASRERNTRFWLGDTWKVVPILKTVRPDLHIFTLPSFPSGLTFVTGLNAQKAYKMDVDALKDEWMPLEFDYTPAQTQTLLNVIDVADEQQLFRLLSQRNIN